MLLIYILLLHFFNLCAMFVVHNKETKMDIPEKYHLDKSEIIQTHKTLLKIYHTLVVLETFCQINYVNEEIVNITPMISYLKKEADVLYAKFSNITD